MNNYVCSGCGRAELHKMCPAWGTPIYGSGILFTKELQEKYADVRKEALEKKQQWIDDCVAKGIDPSGLS